MHSAFVEWAKRKLRPNSRLVVWQVPFRVARHSQCGCSVARERTGGNGWHPWEGQPVRWADPAFCVRRGPKGVLLHEGCGRPV